MDVCLTFTSLFGGYPGISRGKPRNVPPFPPTIHHPPKFSRRACCGWGREDADCKFAVPQSEEKEEASTRIAMEKPVCCNLCGRRHVLGALAAALSMNSSRRMARASFDHYDPKLVGESPHTARPGWYEELYAVQMDVGMKSYEKQMAGYKAQLFNSLDNEAQIFLELGVGTGPNIKYYAKRPEMSIIAVDPNQHMEKYARAAASVAGLQDSQFKFVQAVGEALPVATSSVDAVICTLVLCSVKDVAATLKEVKRVLRPGGSFLFIEHVAAPVGSSLRFWQDLLDPVQQFLVDGCHLTRNTLDNIQGANFTIVNVRNINVSNLAVFSPHIIGMAQA